MAESENKKTTLITSSENDKYKFLSEYDELVLKDLESYSRKKKQIKYLILMKKTP